MVSSWPTSAGANIAAHDINGPYMRNLTNLCHAEFSRENIKYICIFSPFAVRGWYIQWKPFRVEDKDRLTYTVYSIVHMPVSAQE